MRIYDLDRGSSVTGGTSGEKKVKKSSNSSFSSSYNQAEKDNQQEYIKKTLKNIAEKGDTLKNRMSLKDFMEYKSVIKDFMEYIIKNSYEYSKESKISRSGNYRVFGIIKQVDEQLEKLAEEFLKDEKDRFKIISHITGIQGLLLDMSM